MHPLSLPSLPCREADLNIQLAAAESGAAAAAQELAAAQAAAQEAAQQREAAEQRVAGGGGGGREAAGGQCCEGTRLAALPSIARSLIQPLIPCLLADTASASARLALPIPCPSPLVQAWRRSSPRPSRRRRRRPPPRAQRAPRQRSCGTPPLSRQARGVRVGCGLCFGCELRWAWQGPTGPGCIEHERTRAGSAFWPVGDTWLCCTSTRCRPAGRRSWRRGCGHRRPTNSTCRSGYGMPAAVLTYKLP